jgi:RNA-directed DNA polymerase
VGRRRSRRSREADCRSLTQSAALDEIASITYGYRPGVGAYDAIKALTDELQFGGHHFGVEADIKGFFDHLRWEWLERMLEQRIADGAFLNLVRKWLRAGILEEDGRVREYRPPESVREAPGNRRPCLDNAKP